MMTDTPLRSRSGARTPSRIVLQQRYLLKHCSVQFEHNPDMTHVFVTVFFYILLTLSTRFSVSGAKGHRDTMRRTSRRVALSSLQPMAFVSADTAQRLGSSEDALQQKNQAFDHSARPHFCIHFIL
jgi:hypothetical protein